MTKVTTITFLLILFTGGWVICQVPGFCLTKEEYRLFTLINEYRSKKGLDVIPVSKSLCYVAKIHARDLFINRPDTSFCSLNSWSDKGKWTACCHSRNTPNPSCILNKPAELTKYTGEGHELCYWDSEQLHPDTVFNFWLSIDQARELLLNEKKYNLNYWRAMGIGLYKGYACVWVGEVHDTLPEPSLCGNDPGADDLALPLKDPPKDVVSSPTGRYYIIFGSFNSVEDALKMIKKYKKEGFYQAKVIVKGDTYRVSLGDHATQQEALNARKMLEAQYKEAWVTKY